MKGSTLNALKTAVLPPDLLPLLPALAGTVQGPRAITPEQYGGREGVILSSPLMSQLRRLWQFLANPELDPGSGPRCELQSPWPTDIRPSGSVLQTSDSALLASYVALTNTDV